MDKKKLTLEDKVKIIQTYLMLDYTIVIGNCSFTATQLVSKQDKGETIIHVLSAFTRGDKCFCVISETVNGCEPNLDMVGLSHDLCKKLYMIDSKGSVKMFLSVFTDLELESSIIPSLITAVAPYLYIGNLVILFHELLGVYTAKMEELYNSNSHAIISRVPESLMDLAAACYGLAHKMASKAAERIKTYSQVSNN